LNALILDEQVARPRLVVALSDRGMLAQTVGDYGATGRPDPDVVRRISEQQPGPWVLVTMDLTIVEDYPGFDWSRYAIAWIRVDEHLRGAKVEHQKNEIIHRHAHSMLEQRPGDHHTYTAMNRYKTRPSLAYMLRRRA
jgi:hypothetical protein